MIDKDHYLYSLFGPNFLQACQFDCNVSPGDFVGVSQETSKKRGPDGTLEEEIKGDGDKEDATILFSCPNEGCVKM